MFSNYGITESSFGVGYNQPFPGAMVYGIPKVLAGVWMGPGFLPYGKVIVGSRNDVRLPQNSTDVFLGVVVYTRVIPVKEGINWDRATGDRGFSPTDTIDFSRNGALYVRCAAPCVEGERAAFVYGGPTAGDIVPESAAAGVAIVIPGSRILKGTSTPGLVGVEFNEP